MKVTSTLLLFFVISTASSQVSLDQMTSESGSYAVGFKHFLAHDSSRTYQRIFDWNNEFIPRPIPISIWYPVKRNTSAKLKVLDYMRILKEEEEWEHLPDEFILNWFYYPNTEENQMHLKEQTIAQHNVEMVDGKFPVVIYAPSYQASSVENFSLCELLASHGYIVISGPSRGSKNRFFEGGTLNDAGTQARDIQFLLSKVKSFPNVDPNRIATVGFSFGGLSNVLAYAQNKDIKAIVSLDGSIKYQYKTVQSSPFFSVDDFNIPFLHMSQKDIPMDVMIADDIDTTLNNRFEFFDQLTNADAMHFKFNHLTHSYFSSMGVLFQPRDSRQDKSDLEIMESYKWMSLYTLHFFNTNLKESSVSEDWLANSPEENGIEEKVISKMAVKHPTIKMVSFQDFNEQASKQDYDELGELYEKTLEANPDFEIPEGRLNNLGLQLVFNPKTSENGIKVFLFAIERYPTSANLYDSLAEGYLHLGDEKNALISFKKSIALDATNQNAINRIKELSN